jgi:toxin-antitoxin system PIN domain toxin
MTLADVNVLVSAFRRDAERHRECRTWLDSAVNGDDLFAVSPEILNSVIRVLTNRRIYKQPDSIEKALHFANTLLEQSNCVPVSPGARHWMIFCDLCRRTKASGGLVPDAWFAALAIESGCEWVTMDRDFARFEGLRWRTPF